jgi:hypothetical protein
MAFRNTLVAATAFLSAASAHIIMENPVPYSKDKIDNGPISGSQFPCKIQNGFEVTEMNKMAVGQKQQLSFKGSAVHNGGTCQLSVALGTEPTADTPFKVIKTIEGGCPGKNGPEVFDFELPDSIPDGEHTFAWTWMPVSSGQPEYYMNCAPIEVSGGASDESAFSSLPDMLVANLKDKTDCTQVVNTVLKVPNPGEVIEVLDEATEHAPPTGNCGAAGGSPAPPAKKSSTPAADQPTAVPSNTGGLFAPSASSAAPESTTLVTVTASPQPPVETPTATVPAESGFPTPSGTPSGTPIGSGSPSLPTGGAPSNGGQACSENGAIVCNGPTQFGLCNNGAVVFQDVAAGTTCVDGKISKRDSYYGRIMRGRV